MNMFFRYLMVVITLFATAGCSKRLDETSLPTYIRINDVYTIHKCHCSLKMASI